MQSLLVVNYCPWRSHGETGKNQEAVEIVTKIWCG